MNAAPADILVIKLGALGDFLQALGPMAAIRAAHPFDRITLMTTKPFEQLGRDCGYFTDIIIDQKPRWHQLGKSLALFRTLNAKNFRRVYDLQNNDRTSFYFRFFSPKPEWVGIAAGASHRNASQLRTAGKAFDGHVQTLGLAGIKNIQPDRLRWMNGRSDFEGLRTPYVLLVPGGSPQHLRKRWPIERYADLGQRLIADGLLPVILGGGAEADVTRRLHDLVPRALDLTGKTTLYDIAALGRGAYGAVGNDTGPMHLIAPTGCKCIVLFSSASNPARHAPLGSDVVTLQQNNLEDLDFETVWKAFSAQHISV